MACGVITADITPDEAGAWIEASTDAQLARRIFLVAPSSTAERIALTTAASSGFVYAAAVMGVTGARDQVGPAAEALVARTRAVTDLPVCVGLGVSTGEQAAEIGPLRGRGDRGLGLRACPARRARRRQRASSGSARWPASFVRGSIVPRRRRWDGAR